MLVMGVIAPIGLITGLRGPSPRRLKGMDLCLQPIITPWFGARAVHARVVSVSRLRTVEVA
jgi:hypothetical protein